MRNIILPILIVLGGLSLSSCKDSFLNRVPENSYVADNFYASDEALEAATAPLYNRAWFDYNSRASMYLGSTRRRQGPHPGSRSDAPGLLRDRDTACPCLASLLLTETGNQRPDRRPRCRRPAKGPPGLLAPGAPRQHARHHRRGALTGSSRPAVLLALRVPCAPADARAQNPCDWAKPLIQETSWHQRFCPISHRKRQTAATGASYFAFGRSAHQGFCPLAGLVRQTRWVGTRTPSRLPNGSGLLAAILGH